MTESTLFHSLKKKNVYFMIILSDDAYIDCPLSNNWNIESFMCQIDLLKRVKNELFMLILNYLN